MKIYKSCLLCASLLVHSLNPSFAAVKLTEKVRDGRKIIHIENNLIEIEIVPEMGARILRMQRKGGSYSFFHDAGNLALKYSEEANSPISLEWGGYDEKVGPDRWPGKLWRLPYKVTVKEKSNQQVILLAEATEDFCHIERTMTVKDNEAGFNLSITISNVDREEHRMALWLRPLVHPGPMMGDEDLFVLEEKGRIRKDDFVVAGFPWVYHPTSNWWLAIDRNIGEGVLLEFPPPAKINWLKLWHTNIKRCSMELCTKPRSFKPKESETYQFKYRMLGGIYDTDHVQGRTLLDVSLQPDSANSKGMKIVCSRWALAPSKVHSLVYTLSKDGQRVALGSADFAEVSGRVMVKKAQRITLDHLPRGEYVLECKLKNADRVELGQFVTRIRADFTQTQTIARMRERAGKNKTAIEQSINSGKAKRKTSALQLKIEKYYQVAKRSWKNANIESMPVEKKEAELRFLMKYQERLIELLRD